jgi:hypothetical protein
LVIQEYIKSIGLPEVIMLDRKEMIKEYFNSWVENDASILTDLFDAEVIYSECYGPEYHGIGQILIWFEDWHKKGRVMDWNIKQFIIESDTIAVEWYFQCEYESNIDGFDGVSIITFSDENKITSIKEFQSKAQHDYPYGT